MMMADTPPTHWERDLAQGRADRLRAEARDRLRDGRWSIDDLVEGIAAADRRMTAAQRDVLWMALVADSDLAELMERQRT